MKIKVAILGYGNLGKALEENIIKEKIFKLVGIFTRRSNISSPFSTPVFNRQNLLNFQNKIDLLLLCSGNQSDMLNDAPFFTKYFNTINTFDTHELIEKLQSRLNKIAKKHNHFCIVSAGWDPGLFSQIRLMFSSILSSPCNSFWGPGTSLGHTQAVKQIPALEDALAITLPNPKAIAQAKTGKVSEEKHSRQVFVVSNNPQQNKQIETSIKQMDHYFKNQTVSVKFVSQKKLNSIKNFSHSGQIFCTNLAKNNNILLQMSASMQSNPDLTAKIVLSYARVIKKLIKKYPSGAYTPLHFSPLDLSVTSIKQTIKTFC